MVWRRAVVAGVEEHGNAELFTFFVKRQVEVMVVRMPRVYALSAFRAEIDKPVQFPEIGFLVGDLDFGKGKEPIRIFAATKPY